MQQNIQRDNRYEREEHDTIAHNRDRRMTVASVFVSGSKPGKNELGKKCDKYK
jgi:hypothetical protein